MSSGVKLVTISGVTPLFKGEEKAKSIELVSMLENSYNVVAGIGQFKEGDKAVFIEPDYCIPDNVLFNYYHAPGGNKSKSKLGANGRIKAIQFNLHTGDNKKIYSYGLLFPLIDVLGYLGVNNLDDCGDIDKALNVKKIDEYETFKGPDQLNRFPVGMYKTNEENINNIYNTISFPIKLIGTRKVDGSSITIFHRNGHFGICSRNHELPIYVQKVTGIRTPTFWERIRSFFGFDIDLKIYESVESDVGFITVGLPYLNKLREYVSSYKEETGKDLNIVLRGELCGKGINSSNNNSDANGNRCIKFFAVDSYDGYTIKLDEDNFNRIIKDLEFERCEVYFNRTFRSKKELDNKIQSIFDKEELNGRIIEGIVLKTNDSSFSTKYMNLKYDSLK